MNLARVSTGASRSTGTGEKSCTIDQEEAPGVHHHAIVSDNLESSIESLNRKHVNTRLMNARRGRGVPRKRCHVDNKRVTFLREKKVPFLGFFFSSDTAREKNVRTMTDSRATHQRVKRNWNPFVSIDSAEL